MWVRHRITGVAAGLYIWSFFLPTVGSFHALPHETPATGWGAFVYCWEVLLKFCPQYFYWWIYSSSWLVNPLVWVSVVARIRGNLQTCRNLASFALLICFITFTFHWKAVARFPGFWAWAGSVFLLLMSTFPRNLETQNTRVQTS